jgi:hypothetical protein
LWGTPYIASIMLNTMTVYGWCVLPVLFPSCSSNLDLAHHTNVCGGPLAFHYINLVSHIAFCQSLACVVSLYHHTNVCTHHGWTCEIYPPPSPDRRPPTDLHTACRDALGLHWLDQHLGLASSRRRQLRRNWGHAEAIHILQQRTATHRIAAQLCETANDKVWQACLTLSKQSLAERKHNISVELQLLGPVATRLCRPSHAPQSHVQLQCGLAQ